MVRRTGRFLASAWMAALLMLVGLPANAAAPNPKPAAGASDWPDIDKWREVTPEELAMESEPRAPGAGAIYLYTQVERNDNSGTEKTYRQVKILTEAGRGLANVTINYQKDKEAVEDVEARVIHPDGKVIPFSGKVYDRPVVANRDLGVYAKSFTMEDVRVGSVIEYRFRRQYDNGLIATNARWLLSQELFTRHARYLLRMNPALGVRWSWPAGLPEGTSPPQSEKGLVRMQIRNVPAFVTEEFMPPANDLQLAVNFTYVTESKPTTDSVKFWNDLAKQRLVSLERFVGEPKAMQERLNEIIAPGDSNEQKLRKIYAHVQQLRNTEDVPQSERKNASKLCRTPLSAREVAKNGCGAGGHLQEYFIALVRAAGMPAMPALIASRKDRFFQPQSNLSSGITGWVVDVKLDGKRVLLAPGYPVLPFGTLAWVDTAVPALVQEGESWTWITTPLPKPQDAVTHRKSRFTLSEDGVLEGTVLVRHTGHEAIQRLSSLRHADEQDRKEALQEELRRVLAVPAEVTVMRQPDWSSRNAIIETEYSVKVPQWAVNAGNRLMVGIGLFGKEQNGKFVAPNREQPIYFSFPFIAEDEMEIVLPAGFKLQGAPAARNSADAALGYSTSVESRGNAVVIHRKLSHEVLLARQNQYPRFRSFYELVRTADQEQLVLAR